MPKPYIVGIAGGTASGKTTFCDKLESSLCGIRIKVIHMDSYFKAEKDLPKAEAPIVGAVYDDYNHPDSFDMAGLKMEIQKSLENKKFDIIIIEGLLILWDKETCSLLDLKLFVDCKADERIVRRLKRNMAWGLSFDEISNMYLDVVRYRHDEFVEPGKWKADFILNGSVFSSKALDIIREHIIKECEK